MSYKQKHRNVVQMPFTAHDMPPVWHHVTVLTDWSLWRLIKRMTTLPVVQNSAIFQVDYQR